MFISEEQDASSLYKSEGSKTKIQLYDISDFVSENKISRIDLIKINIEGGEYPLLNRMLDQDLVRRCTDIQIQFHNFIEDADSKRQILRERLAKTHHLTYDYPFIWENWKKSI
jgi:hypothetical protein